MKVELKLYKTFDADLISLSSHGISISALIKTALFHYVRDEIARFYVPECKSFDLEGRKRFIHIAVNIDDPVSVDFLKHQLKSRQRAAFLRALLRECLVTQQLGAFLKNDSWIEKETSRMRKVDLSTMAHVVELKFNEHKHDYIQKIIKPHGSAATRLNTSAHKDGNGKIKTSNQFGDISDLSIKNNKEIINQPAAASLIDDSISQLKPKFITEAKIEKETETAVPEDELPFADFEERKNFFDEDDEDEPALDDELFAQFQNLTGN